MNRPHVTFPFFLYDHTARKFHALRDGTTIGRTEGDVNFPFDDLISRVHCRFSVIGNEIYVEDFASTNQTRVNSVPIQPRRKRRLRLNDVVEIGSQRFILSHQTKNLPGHIEDVPRPGKIYKALKKETGGLTVAARGPAPDRTCVAVDWKTFQQLKLKHRLKPVQQLVTRPRRRRFGIFSFLQRMLFWN